MCFCIIWNAANNGGILNIKKKGKESSKYPKDSLNTHVNIKGPMNALVILKKNTINSAFDLRDKKDYQ